MKKRKVGFVVGAAVVLLVAWRSGSLEKTSSARRSQVSSSDAPERPQKTSVVTAKPGRSRVPSSQVGLRAQLEGSSVSNVSTPRASHAFDSQRENEFAERSRWQAPGQCLDESQHEERRRYLSTFEPSENVLVNVDELPRFHVFAAPGTSKLLRLRVEQVLLLTTSGYVEEFAPPTLYLHESAEKMREFACVAGSAVSYYDGAIHVADPGSWGELSRSIRHEYAHHLLVELGIHRPLWLQEGFAQRFAGERPDREAKRPVPLPLSSMVDPLSVRSSDEELAEFYYQSFMMMEFLSRLDGPNDGGDGEPLFERLSTGLLTNEASADGLFVWAADQLSEGLYDGSPPQLWGLFYRDGELPSAVQERIAQRRKAPH